MLKRRIELKTILIVVAGIFIFGLSASAAGTKMGEKDRLAIVKALKNKGNVGENSKGLLEFRNDDKKAEEVIKEENSARLAKYKDIAEKTGTTPEKVGEQRANQILQEDPSGTWHQAPDGKWSQKK